MLVTKVMKQVRSLLRTSVAAVVVHKGGSRCEHLALADLAYEGHSIFLLTS